jgi:hypothetical protein
MGSLLSRVKPKAATPRRVALVGLTETGKSHFLSVLCGDGTEVMSAVHGPTYGMDRVQWRIDGQPVEFVEFGWASLAVGVKEDLQTGQPFDTIVWFIDEHDTLTDVLRARSALLAFVETQSIPTALCIILNKGRPRPIRRSVQEGRWVVDSVVDAVPQGGDRIVDWVLLPKFADVTGLARYFVGGIYTTELSYTDSQAASLCLEWIMDQAGQPL